MRLQVSPRQFAGWEPRQWHRPGPNGEVLVYTEPRWDAVDQRIILTHLMNEDLRCSGCGDYLDLTMPTDHVYEIHEQRCQRCNAIATYKEEQHFDKKPPGTFVTAQRIMLADLEQHRSR